MADYSENLALNVDKFLKGLKDAESGLKSWVAKMKGDMKDSARSFDEAAGSFREFTKAFARPAAVITALEEITRRAAAAAEQIEILGMQTGFSADEIQDWQVAVNRAGADMSSLTFGMKMFAQQLKEAQQETGNGGQLMATLGVDVTAALKNPNAAMKQVAESLSKMDDGFEKSSLMQQAFGRGALQLISTLNGGRAGIEEAAAALDKMGARMDGVVINHLSRLDNAFDDLGTAMMGTKNIIGADLSPVVEYFVDLVLQAVSAFNKLINNTYARSFFAGIAIALELVNTELTRLVSVGSLAGGVMSRLFGGDFKNMARDMKVMIKEFTDVQAMITKDLKAKVGEKLDFAAGGGNAKAKKDTEEQRRLNDLNRKQELDSQKKMQDAEKGLLEARQKLREADLSAKKNYIDALSQLAAAGIELDKEEQAVYSEELGKNKATQNSEREFLARDLELKLGALNDEKKIAQERLTNLIATHDARRRLVVAQTAVEVKDLLDRQHKRLESEQLAARSKVGLSAMDTMSAAEKAPLVAQIKLIDKLAELEEMKNKTKATGIKVSIDAAVAEGKYNLALAESADTLARLEQDRQNGLVTEAQFIQQKAVLQQKGRQEEITRQKELISRMAVGDAQRIKEEAKVQEMIKKNTLTTALETEQGKQAIRSESLAADVNIAKSKLVIAQEELRSSEDLAKAQLEVYKAEKAAELASFVGTTAEKEAKMAEHDAKIAHMQRRATGGFLEGMREGLILYVQNIESAFGFAQDMAREVAQNMQNAFKTFFFDFFEGKIQSMKDIMKGLTDFAKKIFADLASQFATAMVMKGLMSLVGGMGGGGGFGGLAAQNFSSTNFFGKKEGGFVGTKRFSIGGPVMGAGMGDTVPALLQPGEFVLSKDMIKGIKDGGKGSVMNINIVVNAGEGGKKQSGAGPPNFQQLARDLSKMVESKLIEEQRPGGLLAGG